MAEVKKGFRFSVVGRKAARKLLQFHQDSRSVADYAVDCRTLAAESAWNPESLFDTFLHGLLEEVEDELAVAYGSRFAHRLDHLDRWATMEM